MNPRTVDKVEEWVKWALSNLLEHKAAKMEVVTAEFAASAYWAGKVLRIDIKPRGVSSE